jgi:hypothetical protein
MTLFKNHSSEYFFCFYNNTTTEREIGGLKRLCHLVYVYIYIHMRHVLVAGKSLLSRELSLDDAITLLPL